MEDDRCPKCDSDRVAIEALPLGDDPVILVCRSCDHAWSVGGTVSTGISGEGER